ncbi:MAG: DUF6605 domain-containing protein [Saprospiraceae bacterium]
MVKQWMQWFKNGLATLIGLGLLIAGLFLYEFYKAHKKPITHHVALPEPCAFTAPKSFNQHEIIPIKVHAPNGGNRQLFRLGQSWEAIGEPVSIPPFTQTDWYNSWSGFEWEVTDTVKLTKPLSGYYCVAYADSNNPSQVYYQALHIHPDTVPPVVLISCTNTWQAYNHFGGQSNYVDNVRPAYYQKGLWLLNKIFPQLKPLVHLPFNRPYANGGDIWEHQHPALRWNEEDTFRWHAEWPGEWVTAAFLERIGVKYGVYTDRDLSNVSALQEARLWIISGHSEYWTEEMVAQLEQFLAKGGKVAFLSGNNLYHPS